MDVSWEITPSKKWRNWPISNLKADTHNINVHTKLVKSIDILLKLSAETKIRTDVRQTDGRAGGQTDDQPGTIILAALVWRGNICTIYIFVIKLVPSCTQSITKTRLYSFDPLKPHFYIVKLGFTGAYIIFFISAQKHRLWVLVRTASSRRF